MSTLRCHPFAPVVALALLGACTNNANSTGTSSAGGALANGGAFAGGVASDSAASAGVTSGGVASGGGAASGGAQLATGGDGGATASGGSTGVAGLGGRGDARGGSEPGGGGGVGGGSCTGPSGTISGALATGIALLDSDGKRVNAHGGGIIREGDSFYLHGEVFSSASTTNDFVGFSMYSSKDLATWKNEGIILPTQASGELGPNRKGERPHIIKCPSSGEFVLYAHAASEDYQTDREVVFATSKTVNGQYVYRGPLKSADGKLAEHSDLSAYADQTGAYVLTESGHVYTLAADCHSWTSDQTFPAVNGDSGGSESPTLFKAGTTYYWIGSYKTGWRANNNFYSTAPAVTGPWTYRGFVAPVTDPNDSVSDQRTWLSQSTCVVPIVGCTGTVYVYLGDHWDGTESTTAPGRHNDLATYVLQPLVFTGINIAMPTYLATWKLDVGAGTWSP